MAKSKQIKTWRIKQTVIDEGRVPTLLFDSLNQNHEIFANVNQSIGAICESTSPRHMQTVFEAYVTYGVWLSQNNLIEINFKPKGGENKYPTYC